MNNQGPSRSNGSEQQSPRRRVRNIRSNRLRSINERPQISSLFVGGQNPSNGRVIPTNGGLNSRDLAAHDARLEEGSRGDVSASSSNGSSISRGSKSSPAFAPQPSLKQPPPTSLHHKVSNEEEQYSRLNLRGMMSPGRYSPKAFSGADLPSDYLAENTIRQQQPQQFLKPPPPQAVPATATSVSSSADYDDLIHMKLAAMNGPQRPPAAPKAPPATYIEIAPGISARLRGAKETYACIENDFFLPTTCFCCEENLFCIMDADFVLCPHCRVVSPMGEETGGPSDGGVGLGFTYDDLQNYQSDILSQQQQQRREQLGF